MNYEVYSITIGNGKSWERMTVTSDLSEAVAEAKVEAADNPTAMVRVMHRNRIVWRASRGFDQAELRRAGIQESHYVRAILAHGLGGAVQANARKHAA